MMEVKRCTKCKEDKPISEFYRDTSSKDGFVSRCKVCLSEYQSNYYLERREDLLAYAKKYDSEHAEEKRSCELQYKYGITIEEYDNMLEAQDNSCAICWKTPEENGRRLCVDHDHETGEVRGLLCRNCNVALGYLQDSQVLCRAAMMYLRRTEK